VTTGGAGKSYQLGLRDFGLGYLGVGGALVGVLRRYCSVLVVCIVCTR
jgi:hypothetical protein